MDTSSKTVFVGLSGGVDSSVAALRLLKEGYNVVGVFIKVWHPDFLKCNWEEERLDAMRVAAHLNIPFLTCDAEEEYRTGVGEYFIKEYLEGRTPNPDVMCNKYVKFGAFLNFAKANGADFIATGHYAQVQNDNGVYKLLRGKDQSKDQSYFLWTLTQNELKHTIFPVGDTLKDDIRREAQEAGIPTAVKKDSQGICFLGQVDIPEFLSYFTKLEVGKVINTSGEQIGTHRGALVYTLGQRHGFSISNNISNVMPHYVVDRDLNENIITVDTTPPQINSNDIITLENMNWMSNTSDKLEDLTAQFRYRQTPIPVNIYKKTLVPLIEIEKPAAGQSVVFYKGNECLGGGVIK